jgi:Arc/MetJ family transcription regulator
MKQALAASGSKTKREVVEKALKLLITLSRQREIRSLRGELNWDGDLESMRLDP